MYKTWIFQFIVLQVCCLGIITQFTETVTRIRATERAFLFYRGHTSIDAETGGLSVHVCPSTPTLWHMAPPAALPFRLQIISIGRRHGITALLLLMAGIKQNPGPARQNSSRRSQAALKIGLLNARSAMNKAAQIHSVIEDHDLDLVILTETWIARNAPQAVKGDIAPEGYKIHHAHRSAQGKKGEQ